MKDAELMKRVEEDLLYWLPLARGEVCSPDLYLLTKVLPAADMCGPLRGEFVEKLKAIVKDNPVFERPEAKIEFDYFFEKLGIIEKKKE